MVFTRLHGWGKNQEEYFMTLQLYGIHMAVSINNAFLTHSHVHLHIVCGCSRPARAELRSCNGDHVARNPKYLLSDLHRSSLLTPALYVILRGAEACSFEHTLNIGVFLLFVNLNKSTNIYQVFTMC